MTQLENPERASWWNRPGGAREVLRISLPLVISTLSFAVMHFCDRMFLAWYSEIALGASVVAGAFVWTSFSLPMGLAAYATTFVAQYHGAGQDNRIGLVIWQAIRIGLYSVPFFLGLAFVAPILFVLAGHTRELVIQETLYFQALAPCAGGAVMTAALESFFIGRGKTRVIMITNILAAGLNIVLDAWLIFGGLGIPMLGIAGAGIATSIATWFKVALYASVMMTARNRTRYEIMSHRRFDWPLTKRLLTFGTPNGVTFCLEGCAITIFVFLMGRLSAEAAAATSLAFSVNMVAFVPVIGMGMGLTTIVGQKIGSGRPDLAAYATRTSLIIAFLYSGVFAFAYLAVPHWFLAAHSAGASEFEGIRDLVVVLLRFVAAYCLFDAIQVVYVSAIKGAGDTRYVLIVTVLSAIGFVVGGQFAAAQTDVVHTKILVWWFALTAWIIALAVCYAVRFWMGKWKTMSVIEPDLIDKVNANDSGPRIEEPHEEKVSQLTSPGSV